MRCGQAAIEVMVLFRCLASLWLAMCSGVVHAAGEAVPVPAFSVQVALTPAAADQLRRLGELVVVDVAVLGDPAPGAPLDEDGNFYLIYSVTRKVASPWRAHFEGLQIPAARLQHSVGGRYRLAVSAYNAGAASALNVLDCQYLALPPAELPAAGLELKCAAIGE